jgi:hypothetical protein
MKRQLGTVLAMLVLCCAPLAWSQSDSSDSDSSNASSSSPSSSDSAASGASTLGSGVAINSTYTPYTDPYFQVGSGDPSQSGSDSGSDDTQTQTGPQSTFSHPEQLPPLAMINDVTKNTGLGLSLNVGSLNNYVKGGSGQASYWQNMVMSAGGIGFSQMRSTSLIQLGYIGGVNLTGMTFGTNSTYTTLSQQANARILWNFANHWQMRIKDNYLYTDDPFQPFLTYVSDPTPNQPNPTVYFPQAVIEQNQGSADISYRLSAHDSITFSGSESFQHYIRGASGLWNSFTWGGGSYYQHIFNDHFSAGGGYNFSALDFGHGQSRAGVQMIEGFVVYKFNNSLSVSGWVGPELTHTKDMIPIFCTPQGCLIEAYHSKEWDVAEGGTLTYMKGKNSVRFQFSHRVTDGGGVLGAVSLYQATIAYARPLGRLWGFSAAGMWDNSTSVSHVRANQYWDATQGMLNFTRKIGESWNGSIFLLLIHQTQNFYGTPGTSSTAGLGLTLRYVWGHSIGR